MESMEAFSAVPSDYESVPGSLCLRPAILPGSRWQMPFTVISAKPQDPTEVMGGGRRAPNSHGLHG